MVFKKVCVLVLSTKLASYDGASVNGRKKIVKTRNFFLILSFFRKNLKKNYVVFKKNNGFFIHFLLPFTPAPS